MGEGLGIISTVKVILNGGMARELEYGANLLQLAGEAQPGYQARIVAARVNNNLRELTHALTEDASIEFVDMSDDEGFLIYQRSLTFLLIKAVGELYPRARVVVKSSISKGLYCELQNMGDITEREVAAIEQLMRDLVAQDIPFHKERVSKAEAIKLFEKEQQADKVRLMHYRDKEYVHLYSCGWLRDYFYGYMVPSTGYLPVFELKYYMPGFILRFPEQRAPEGLPPYAEQPKLFNILREAEQWGGILEVPDVGSLNDRLAAGDAGDLIRVAEAFHEKKIAQCADMIARERDQIRLILIAGPSSSGKTTFAQRLSVGLKVNGVKPAPISIDDYFVDREQTPLDEQGEPDFEAIAALDLELFNDHLIKLIHGLEVEVPYYNFTTGKREYRGRKIMVKRDQPIIIEGIHGLNDRLTEAIPRGRKFKVYVSALTQLNLDSHNRIPTTDARKIRRIVRDSQFRNHDALATIRIWPKVRRGEDRNIFPFQEDADIMFNSHLPYEMAVLKGYAEPLLQSLPAEAAERIEAKRLLKLLSYFRTVDESDIPTNSIIREFIGNSCFFRG